MQFSDAEIQEFKNEASDLLEAAERSLIAIDRGEHLDRHYDSVFRGFHTVKGAAGMMGMERLQEHVHLIESALVLQKATGSISKAYIEMFLRGIDASRTLLNGGQITFSYEIESQADVSQIISRAASPAPVLHGRIVVVVDDGKGVVDLLRNGGFEVIGPVDRLDLADVLPSYLPNVVVVGFASAEAGILPEIKKINGDVSIVVVGDAVDEGLIRQAIAQGAFDIQDCRLTSTRLIPTCLRAVERNKLMQLLNQSLKLLSFQFSDLREYLVASGKEDLANVVGREIRDLMTRRSLIRRPQDATN